MKIQLKILTNIFLLQHQQREDSRTLNWRWLCEACICGYWWARSHEGGLPIWLNNIIQATLHDFLKQKITCDNTICECHDNVPSASYRTNKRGLGRDGVKRLTRQFKSCFTWFPWIRHSWYMLIIVVHIMIFAKPCL